MLIPFTYYPIYEDMRCLVKWGLPNHISDYIYIFPMQTSFH